MLATVFLAISVIILSVCLLSVVCDLKNLKERINKLEGK